MFLLILESLGSTELFFILVMALIFFGPRKLPQLSRTLGKNLAEFRKVSEDFKRTWEREVAMEDLYSEPTERPKNPGDNSILSLSEPPQEQVVARQAGPTISNPTDPTNPPTEPGTSREPSRAEPLRKQDWL
ncbi:MAG: twin-arginine translocase TatA/TatE family subunit [Acidobacteriota bacterium]